MKLDFNSFHLNLVYLDVQSSAISSTDLQLKFNFAAGTATYPYVPRSWNIKIAMLPCGASYLGNILSQFRNSALNSFLLIPCSSQGLPPVFRVFFRQGQFVQLAGRGQHSHAPTQQSKLQNLFQGGINQSASDGTAIPIISPTKI